MRQYTIHFRFFSQTARKYLTAIFFIICSVQLNGGNFIRYGGAYATGLGQATVAYPNAGYFQNQALLSSFDSLYIELSSNMPFAVKEFGTHSLFGAYPALGGVFALQYHYFGYNNYNENKTGLAYAISLGKGFSMGAQINWFRIYIPQPYGVVNNFMAEFGLYYKMNRYISFGAHVYNPTLTTPVKEIDENPETAIRVGIAYTPLSSIAFNFEVVQWLNYPISFRTGIDFILIKNLMLQAGYNHDNKTIAFGLGLNIKGLRVSGAATYHNILGYTPHMSIGKFF